MTNQPTKPTAQITPNERILANELYIERIRYALEAGLFTVLISVLVTMLVINMNPAAFAATPNQMAFYHDYTEWGQEAAEEVASGPIELGLSTVTGSVLNILDILINNMTNIAGISRTISICTVSLFVFIYYRKSLEKHLELSKAPAQLDDYQKLKKDQWIQKILFTLATAFGIYILTSLVLRLLAFALVDLSLHYFFATVLIAMIAAVFTALAVFWSSAIDSREILLLGLGTWLGGMLLSFILFERNPIDGHWWQNAISAAGTWRPASPVFRSAFTSAFFALLVVWFDIDSIIATFIRAYREGEAVANNPAPNAPKVLSTTGQNAVGDKQFMQPVHTGRNALFKLINALFGVFDWLLEGILRVLAKILIKMSDGKSLTDEEKKELEKRINSRILNIIGWLYIGIGIGLLLIGLVPVNLQGLKIFHYLGAIAAVIGIAFLVIIIPKRNYFQAFYRLFTYASLPILVFVFIEFGLCEWLMNCGDFKINLAGLEIFVLFFVVVWSFATLDGLIFYMNVNWDRLQASWNIVVEEKAEQRAKQGEAKASQTK